MTTTMLWYLLFVAGSAFAFPTESEVKNILGPKVSQSLESLAERQIGAERLRQLYNQPLRIQQNGNHQQHVSTLVLSVDKHLTEATKTLTETRDLIQQELNNNQKGAAGFHCCGTVPKNGVKDPLFKQYISMSQCVETPPTKGLRIPGRKLSQATQTKMQDNFRNRKFPLLWQYYGDLKGNFHQFPNGDRFCGQNGKFEDNRFQNWFVNTLSPRRKNIVVVVDESASMGNPTLGFQTVAPGKGENYTRKYFAKEAAITVLNTLGQNDMGGVIAFSSFQRTAVGCLGDQVVRTTPENIKHLTDFAHTIKVETDLRKIGNQSSTYYRVALEKAFKMFEMARKAYTSDFDDGENIILFLSDGGPMDSKPKIFETVAAEQKKLNESQKVHILAYALAKSPSRSISDLMCKLSDLNNLGQCDGRTAQAWKNEPKPLGPKGSYTFVNDLYADKLKEFMASYYTQLPASRSPVPAINLPQWDNSIKKLRLTMGLPTFDTAKNVVGVAAQDVDFATIVEDVVDFKFGSTSYAFLVDSRGQVLTHPRIPDPDKHNKEPTFFDLSRLEPDIPSNIRRDILSGKSGSYKTTISVPISRGNSKLNGAVLKKKSATLFFEPVPSLNGSYSVVTAIFDDDVQQPIPDVKIGLLPPMLKNTLYHRLDLLKSKQGQQQVCCVKQGQNLNTFNAESTAKFSPDAFKDPRAYLNNKEDGTSVEQMNKYLGSSKSPPNVGLKDEVFPDVLLTASMTPFWQRNKEALIKYLGTETGLMRVHPGRQMNKNYDPRQQSWYHQATLNPSKYTFSRPHVSKFKPGSIAVTISKTFHHGSSTTLAMAGVSAADLDKNYITSLVESACKTHKDTQCILLDDSGYVMEEGNLKNGQLQPIHLTEEFSWLAKELMSTFLKPKTCNDYLTGKDLRFYDTSNFNFATSSSTAPCKKYHLVAIPKTNLYLLVLRSRLQITCTDRGTNICSCSSSTTCSSCTKSNLCQCPCQCPIKNDQCHLPNTLGPVNLVCPAPPKHEDVNPPAPTFPKPCFNPCKPTCAGSNQSRCAAQKGKCTWCSTGRYRNNPVCADVCLGDKGVEFELFFPCHDFDAMVGSWRTHIVDLVREDVFNIHFKQNGVKLEQIKIVEVKKSTIKIKVWDMEPLQLPTVIPVNGFKKKLESGAIASVANMTVTSRNKYSNAHIKMSFNGMDFNNILTKTMGARNQITSSLKTGLKNAGVRQDIIATLANVWLQNTSLPFVLKRLSIIGRADFKTEIDKITASSIKILIEGKSVSPDSISKEWGYHDLCPNNCSFYRTSSLCNQIPGCMLGHYSIPTTKQKTCASNNLLVEKKQFELFVGCKPIFSSLPQVTQDDIYSKIRKKLSADVAELKERMINNFQTHPTNGQIIQFNIQASMQSYNLSAMSTGVKMSIGSEFPLFTNGTSVLRVRLAQDFTNIYIKVRFPGVNFTSELDNDKNLRLSIHKDLKAFLSNAIDRNVANSANNIYPEEDYLSFTIKKNRADAVQLNKQVDILKQEIASKALSLTVAGKKRIADVLLLQKGSFYEICKPKCNTSAIGDQCRKTPGCHYGYSTSNPSNLVCGHNNFLPEQQRFKFFVGCSLTLPTANTAEERDITSYLRTEIANALQLTDYFPVRVKTPFSKNVIEVVLQGTTVHPFTHTWESVMSNTFLYDKYQFPSSKKYKRLDPALPQHASCAPTTTAGKATSRSGNLSSKPTVPSVTGQTSAPPATTAQACAHIKVKTNDNTTKSFNNAEEMKMYVKSLVNGSVCSGNIEVFIVPIETCNRCTGGGTVVQGATPKDTSGLTLAEKLGLGLGIPLAALAGLAGALAGILFRRRKPAVSPPPSARPRKITRKVPFQTNIYKAGMNDDINFAVGKKGAELDPIKNTGIYGGLSSPSETSFTPHK